MLKVLKITPKGFSVTAIFQQSMVSPQIHTGHRFTQISEVLNNSDLSGNVRSR